MFWEPVDDLGDYLILEKESIMALVNVSHLDLILPYSDPGPRLMQLSALKSEEKKKRG